MVVSQKDFKDLVDQVNEAFKRLETRVTELEVELESLQQKTPPKTTKTTKAVKSA